MSYYGAWITLVSALLLLALITNHAALAAPKKRRNWMNYFAKGILTAASLAAVLSLPVVGQAGQAPSSKQVKEKDLEPVGCDNRAPRVTAVKLAAPISNTVDFSGSNGALDPVPLLEAKIFVGG